MTKESIPDVIIAATRGHPYHTNFVPRPILILYLASRVD